MGNTKKIRRKKKDCTDFATLLVQCKPYYNAAKEDMDFSKGFKLS